MFHPADSLVPFLISAEEIENLSVSQAHAEGEASIARAQIRKKSSISVGLVVVLQSLMVAKAKEDLEQELVEKEKQKETYLEEKAPQMNINSMSLEELQVQIRQDAAFPLILGWSLEM